MNLFQVHVTCLKFQLKFQKNWMYYIYSIASHIVIIIFVLSWNKGVTIDLLCQGQRKVRRLLKI